MPTQAPRFRALAARDRKAWQRPANQPDRRKRGRAGMRERAAVLAEEPLCRACLEQGRTSPTEEIDHIVPLAAGGSDERSNKQGLCKPCHRAKSARERGKVFASSHPDWLERSAIPLTIVCGPPCSGKSTYVRERSAPGDVVIDLDTIFTELDPGYEHWGELSDTSLLPEALRIRNAKLGNLKRSRGGRQAWFIVAAPTAAERAWWQAKLGGTVVLLQADEAELKRRAVARGTPNAVEGIDRWLSAAGMPWARAPRRRSR